MGRREYIAKNCARNCGALAPPGERYCEACRKIVLAEMEAVGYLQTGGYGHVGMFRTPEMKELTAETKHGTHNGQGH